MENVFWTITFLFSENISKELYTNMFDEGICPFFVSENIGAVRLGWTY